MYGGLSMTPPKQRAPRGAVVIATYNEAATIGGICAALVPEWDVFICDDSSPDGTAQIAAIMPHVTIISRPGKWGIASAYRTLFDAVLSDPNAYPLILQMDAGGTHPLEAIPAMLAKAQQGAGLVIGARQFTFKGRRTVISLGARALMRAIGVKAPDVTTGFRLWRWSTLMTAYRAVGESSTRGFAFQLEFLWAASRAGTVIESVPVPYRLTNSSFKPSMLTEGLSTVGRLALRR